MMFFACNLKEGGVLTLKGNTRVPVQSPKLAFQAANRVARTTNGI
jgi:hypothetical protein